MTAFISVILNLLVL